MGRIAYLKDLYNTKRTLFCSVSGCRNASSINDIELDHIDPSAKLMDLSKFAWWAQQPLELYEAELAKTQPLCVHHHREKTSHANYKGTSRLRQAKELYFRNAKFERKRCHECGMWVTEENELMFDFHHRSPATKIKACSALKYGSRHKLEFELRKCHLLCVSCHKMITRRGTVESKYFV